MAVKASSNITLFHVIDIDNVTIYYLLQSSTANPPAKPTTDNPGGNWTTTEPTYTEGSTNTLYTVTKTKFSDGNFEYTPVSKSSSYEAAKNAYNKAINAQNVANTTQENLNNLQIGGRNILRKTKTFSNEGVSNTATGYLRSKGTITTTQNIDDFTVITCTPSSAAILGEWLINGCKNGESYTLSFWVKGSGKPRCYFYGPSGYIGCEKVTTQNGTGNSSDGNSDSGAGGVPVSNSEWQRVWVTWKLKDTGGTTDQKYVLIRNDNKVEVYIAGAKFERGDKATDWTPAPEDIDEAPYIAGTQTANTRFWTGVAKFSKLKSGQQITYLNPRNTIEETCGTGKLTGCAGRVDGSHTYAKGVEINSTNVYGEGTKNMVWLNLTLADGTTTDWIPCYYQANSRLTTHYNGGKLIRFTYIENANIAGTLYTGWFADGNYFENTYNRILYNNAIVSNQMYLNSGRLIVSNDYGYVELSRNTKFRIDKPLLYCSSAINICDNGSNNYLDIGSLTLANNLSSPIFNDGNDVIETYISGIGKTLYRGVGVTGTSTSNTKMTSSGITNAVVGDYYRNSSTGYMYRCTTAGNASTATWVYIAWQRNANITGSSTTESIYSGSGISNAILGGFYMNSSTGNIFVCTLAGNASTAKWKCIGTTAKPAGKKWYSGTKITGTDETPKIFSGSGVSSAGVGDYYYNTGTGGYYECTLAGNAQTAKWAYKGVLIEAQQTLYLVGTLSEREFTVADIPFTTNPITPTDESNDYYYIVVGATYSLTAYYLVSEHPIYKYVDGQFKNISQIAYEAQSNLDSYKEDVNIRFRDTVSTSTFEKTNGQLRNEMVSNYGINYILDSMGVFNDNSWTGDVESIDYHNAVGLHAIVINNNTISQKIRIKGGEYTLSFTYIKNEEYADNDNAKLTVKFYDEIFEYTDSVNFKQTKNVFAIDDNIPEITIEFSGNVDNLGIIYDLMLNDGTEIKKWQQNQNETVTDEVTIGRGITCKSSISDTTSYMNTDGFRVKSNSTNIEVMKATSVGGEFNELKSRAKTELNSLLILKFDDVIWLNGGE